MGIRPAGAIPGQELRYDFRPWVVTAEALEPFRTKQHPRPQGDPAPLEYLSDKDDQARGAFDIRVDVLLRSAKMREAGDSAVQVGSVSATDLYWTPAQMLTHHTVNGCDIAAGDLMGTGTISWSTDSQRGSLMELSRGGRNPIALPNDESRTFLEDGDEVIMMGWAERDGFRRIGFGQCAAIIAPSRNQRGHGECISSIDSDRCGTRLGRISNFSCVSGPGDASLFLQ